jgi:hypothetical protein
MAIEKGLYAAPEGIDEDIEEDAGELEIEIVNPDMVTLDDGSVEITLVPGEDIGPTSFDANLAESLEDNALAHISNELVGYVDTDIDSRKDWADTFVKGLDVVGFKYEERTDPWDGACGVFSTILAEAAIRFQAETMSETFPAAGPVRVKILGEENKDKMEAAERVKADMNYELTERMVEYRPEHERCSTALVWQGLRSRRFITTRISCVRWRSMSRLKMLLYLTEPPTLRAPSVLRILCVRPRTNSVNCR